MVNIGLLGDVSVGKTSILRLFVRYLKKGDIAKVEGGIKCSVVKADFSGEATVPGGEKEDALNEKETKTIHPNRIVFREDESNKAHTIFAPGGDRARAVVKMGIITISRIATQIIAVFSLDRDLAPQFEFFNDVRFFPDPAYPSGSHHKPSTALAEEKLALENSNLERWFGKPTGNRWISHP